MNHESQGGEPDAIRVVGYGPPEGSERRGPRGWVIASVVGLVVAVLAVVRFDALREDEAAMSTTTTLPGTTTTSLAPVIGACIPGAPRIGIDQQVERIVERYNAGDADGLVSIIGDGPVVDSTLRPGLIDRYETVGAWVEAARSVGDRLSVNGYGMGEPFALFVLRENRDLEAVGIDRLSVTLTLWVNQDCEVRVDAHHPVSSPDPCRFVDLFSPGAEPGCDGPFEPRAEHVAVWTGAELLIYGGWSGVPDGASLTTGLGFEPSTDTWRRLRPAPVELEWWWSMKAVWAGDRMVVAGRTSHAEGGGSRVLLLSYFPDRDAWEVSPPVPDGRQAVGGLVWTGTEIILAGGDLHYPDDTAWAFSPSSGEWRRLPDPSMPSVEDLQGVWADGEAIFVGGYAHLQQTPTVAYNPRTESWRDLAPFPLPSIQFHQLVWTGSEVIVHSGYYGPEHPSTLFRYDLATDAWSESAPLPIPPRERLASAWTGDQLILWGGYATYGEVPDVDGHFAHGDGALYDPDADSWTIMAPSPLINRCDHSGTWIGDALVVFGGRPTCGGAFVIPDGHAALYDPLTDRWRELQP